MNANIQEKTSHKNKHFTKFNYQLFKNPQTGKQTEHVIHSSYLSLPLYAV